MEIELITTKKKLTKSIINQMPLANNIDVLNDGVVVGFLLNVRKGCVKVILIKHNNEFYILLSHYRKGSFKFFSEDRRDAWWKIYQARLKEDCPQIFI
jgi:hypothetical protein